MSDSVGQPPDKLCYAVLAADGTVTSFGHMPGNMPSNALSVLKAVQIADSDLSTLVASKGAFKWQNAALVAVPPTPLDLDIAKAKAAAAIDAAAEVARQQFLTPGAGQAMEYQATQEDAARAIADTGSLTVDAYPWLAAEQSALAAIGQTATLLQIAQSVIAQTGDWTTAGALIKAVRRTAKLQVSAATSTDQLTAILKDLVWPTAS